MSRMLAAIIVLLGWMYGCGEDGDGSPPVISNLQYSKDRYLVDASYGTAVIAGRVDGMDPDGDLAFIRVSNQDCGQGPWRDLEALVQKLGKGETGTLPFFTDVRTDCPAGLYAIEISLFDARKNQSDVLEAPFTLYEED